MDLAVGFIITFLLDKQDSLSHRSHDSGIWLRCQYAVDICITFLVCVQTSKWKT